MNGKNPSEFNPDALPELLDLTLYNIDVIIPAYNEERFLGSVILKLQQYHVSVIVVDDGSTDDTALVARLAGATVIQHPKNLGKGKALNTGFQAAQQLAPDAIVTIDADGQHLPEHLPRLVQPVLVGQADIVIGSRYINNASRVPTLRYWGHRFFNFLIQKMSGIYVTDSQSGFRAFSSKAFQADIFHRADFSVETEMQFLAQEHDLEVLEIPIFVRYSDKPKRSVWSHGIIVLIGLIRLVGQYRPLMFFGVPGTTLLLFGFILGLRVFNSFNLYKQLATGSALISGILFILGMILLSTGMIIHCMRGMLREMWRAKNKIS